MVAMTVIDQFGRRRLMLVGSIGYILSLSARPGPSTYGTEFTRQRQAGGAVSLLVFIAVSCALARGR